MNNENGCRFHRSSDERISATTNGRGGEVSTVLKLFKPCRAWGTDERTGGIKRSTN